MTTPQIFLWTNYDHTPKNPVQRRPGPTGGCGLGSQSDISVGPLSLQRQYHCSSVYLCIFVSLFFFVSEVLVSFFPLKNIQVLTKSNTKISLSLPSTVSRSRNFEEICSNRSDNFQTHCILPFRVWKDKSIANTFLCSATSRRWSRYLPRILDEGSLMFLAQEASLVQGERLKQTNCSQRVAIV